MAGNRELRIFVVERDSEPCLIMPLQLSRLGWGLRSLEPIGMERDINRPRLAIGPFEAATYECALTKVWGCRTEWHVLRLFETAEDNPEIDIVRKFALRHGLTFRQQYSHVCPWIDLQQPWEGYLAGRSPKLRQNLRAARRKLEQLGPVTLRSFESAQDIGEGHTVLRNIHNRSWKNSEGIEYGSSEQYGRFYSGWLAEMAALGLARIRVLYSGEHPVAANLVLMTERSCHGAQIVHDPDFSACSPGTLLESLDLEALMQLQSYRIFDLMGAFLTNKLRWTDNVTRVHRIYVSRRSVMGFAFDTYAFGLKPLLKKIQSYRAKHPRAAKTK